MRVFLRGTMMLLCIYAICADAQKYQDYTERLDSIVQMSVEGKRKTVFDYQMDSLYVTEKIYKAMHKDWQLCQIKVRHLNEIGKTTHLDISTMLEGGEVERVFVDFIYDAQGRNVETTWMGKNNRQYEEKGKREFFYDDHDNLIQYTTYDVYDSIPLPVSGTIFKYAINGKMISRINNIWRNGSWELSNSREWTYDEKGRTQCMTEWMKRGKTLRLHGKLEYNYNSQGVLKDVTYRREWSDSARDVRKILFLYDSKGNPVREKHYTLRKDGREKEFSHTIKYRYYKTAPGTSIMGDAYWEDPYVICNSEAIPHGEYKLKEKDTIYSIGLQEWSKYYYSPIKDIERLNQQ